MDNYNYGIYVFITDYGVVTMSEKTKKYLESIDKDWELQWSNMKPRTKKDKRTVLLIDRVCDAASTCAAIMWANGGVLREF